MKIYGYEIVVDSSITEITTQFTFTEKRVKDKKLKKQMQVEASYNEAKSFFERQVWK